MLLSDLHGQSLWQLGGWLTMQGWEIRLFNPGVQSRFKMVGGFGSRNVT
jgi:hypothetical protein